ncbi:MAG: polysaccharide ABC transporter ATP-binding protein [Cyclobacteriaceae bacterium]
MKPILEVNNIGKKYRIQHLAGGYLSLRERMSGVFRSGKSQTEDFWALNNVSFEVKAGESIGIIGRNGAGKSTLLKILSKITPPTKGKIVSRGRIASLLEVGTGFHPELTGRENIFFNGSLLGMKRAEIAGKFDEIVDFSGVEKFLDAPLKHYSSGMQLRLAFAVAAFLEPEILIIDEVLAVGDAEFQKKCLGKMEDVSRSGRTILFVSHNMGAVSKLCPSAMLLSDGTLQYLGDTNRVVSKYLERLSDSDFIQDRHESHKDIYISKIVPQNQLGEATSEFRHDEDVCFDIGINKKVKEDNYRLLVIIQDELKRRVFSAETFIQSEHLQLRIERNILTRGRYSLMCIIYIPAIAKFDVIDDCSSFSITDSGSHFSHLDTFDYGVVFGRSHWQTII